MNSGIAIGIGAMAPRPCSPLSWAKAGTAVSQMAAAAAASIFAALRANGFNSACDAGSIISRMLMLVLVRANWR